MRYKIKLGEYIPGTIRLGYQNENEVKEIEFDPSIWAERYGEGALSLSVQRNGDIDPYPKTLTDNVWTVEAVDVEKNGFGYCQVMYVAGTKVKASAVFKFFVEKSLDATGDLPDPYISYFEQIIETGARATADANRAEAAADSIKDLTATANTLPAGSDASASYDAETGVMTFGIPKGDKGDTGEQGETGNGIQSTVLNADYTLTITFTDGTVYTTPSIRGAQGEQGIQGETGDTGNGIASTVLNADYTLTITFTDGTSYTTPSIRGQQGEQGDPGRVQDVLVNGESVVDGQGNANIDIPIITKTVTGNPIVVDDADGAVQALDVELLPVQDLHGYDKPWSAGAGKNKYSDVFSEYTQPVDYYIKKLPLSNGTWQLTATLIGTAVTGAAVCIAKSGTQYSDFVDRISVISTSGEPTDRILSVDATWTDPVLCMYCSGETQFNQIFSNYHIQLEQGNTATAYEPYSNICPITGRTQTEITDRGVNLFDGETVDGYIDNNTGNVGGHSGYQSTEYIPVFGGQSYYIKSSQTNSAWGAYYDANKTYISGVTRYANSVITVPSNARYMRLTVKSASSGDISTFAVNYPSTYTDYIAYITPTTKTVTLPHTVYGADVDVTGGDGKETLKLIDASTLGWNYDAGGKRWQVIVSDIYNYPSRDATLWSDRYSADTTATTGDEGKMFTVGKGLYIYSTDSTTPPTGQLCYPLATPTDLQTTPTDVELYKGDNVVSGDGDMELTYVRNLQKVIDKIEAAL